MNSYRNRNGVVRIKAVTREVSAGGLFLMASPDNKLQEPTTPPSPPRQRSFRQVIAELLSYVYIIPFVVLYIGIMMRQELFAEWRRLYEELYEDDFAFDSRASFGRGQRDEVDLRLAFSPATFASRASPC
jgi:hypothetical protein